MGRPDAKKCAATQNNGAAAWRWIRRFAFMHKYRSLVAWQRAHQLLLLSMRTTDRAYHPRSRPLFDQIRRAAVSIEANIVEGYALGSTLQFRKHLRIAVGSAAEAECLVRAARELDYLPAKAASELEGLLDGTMRVIRGLLRLPVPTGR